MSEIKVAKVIDDYTFVINKGKEFGLKEGQRIQVYEIGDEIVDPDTNEILTQLEIIKGIGKIQHCQDKISTVKSTMLSDPKKIIIKKQLGNNLGSIASMFATLSVQNPDIVEEIVPADALPFDDVKVGNFVRLL